MPHPIRRRSYQLAPRAQIFRRDAGRVNSTESIAALLRSNDYLHDPIAREGGDGEGNPWSAICARGDLDGASRPYNIPAIGRFSGCTDTKASSAASMFWRRRALAVNGPTFGGGIAPFSWDDDEDGGGATPHDGQPRTFAFELALQEPAA